MYKSTNVRQKPQGAQRASCDLLIEFLNVWDFCTPKRRIMRQDRTDCIGHLGSTVGNNLITDNRRVNFQVYARGKVICDPAGKCRGKIE